MVGDVGSVLDLDGDGRVTLGELVGATGWLFVLVFVGLVVVAVAVAGLVGVPGRDFVRFLVRWWLWVALAVSVVVTVAVGVWRALRYERRERAHRLELSRRWQFEDEDRDRLLGLADRPAGVRVSQAEVDAAAVLYLRRYYSGGGLSRDKWVKDGLSKDLWDRVNGLMLKRGIRRGRRSELVPVAFSDAWLMYCERKLAARSWQVDGGGELFERS